MRLRTLLLIPCLLFPVLLHAQDADERATLEREARGDDEGALQLWLKRLPTIFDRLTAAADPAQPEAQAEARVLAEVGLERALALARATGAAPLAETLAALVERAVDPELRAKVRWALANQYLRLDRMAEARAQVDDLGFLRDWMVIGPFDNEAGRGFLDNGPPESDPDLAAGFDGDVRKVFWRPISAIDTTAYVNLDAHLRPNDEVLAYAATFIKAEALTPAILRVASDEGVRVWLNGSLVWSNDAHRNAGFDQDRVGVMLSPGWNRLLLKVVEGRNDWGFRVRLTDAAGKALGLPCAAQVPAGEKPAPPLPTEAPKPPEPPATAAQWLEARVRAHPEEAVRHFHLGVLRAAAHAEDRSRRTDARLFESAVTGDPGNPHFHFFLALALKDDAAMSAEREENRIRQELERALELFPEHAAAARELAWYYSRTLLDLHQALPYAERACRINPDSAHSRLVYAELLKAGDLAAPQEAEWQEIRRRFPKHPLVLVRAAQREVERKRYPEAAALYEQALAIDALNAMGRVGLADVYLHLDRRDDARACFDRVLAVDPYAIAAWLQKARIEEGRGNWEAAAAETRAALAICPEEDALVARLATQELMAGHREAGLQRLQEAVRLNPNNLAIREYLAHLAGSEQSFHLPYRVDPATVLTGRPPGILPPGAGAQCLLENQAVRVNRDGTQAKYQQRIFVITSAEGIRDFDVIGVPYVVGEQKVSVLTARIHHPDGSADDARTERGGGGAAGEDRTWRRFAVDLPVLEIGDVIEFEVLVEDTQPSFFGDYFGDVVAFGMPSECADFRYTLLVPEERPIYFRPVNLNVQPQEEKTPDGRFKTYRWRLQNLPALDSEPDMPALDLVVPSLEISTFRDWQAFSVWYWNLIKKQHVADDAIRQKVRQLTEGRSDEWEKIRAIYGFVTNEIRYVAWEFGVHGYLPYSATQIFHRRFGDCKDKALLLNVMLGELGIQGRPVLIYAEDQRNRTELPFPLVERFNHCISQVTRADGSVLYLDATATFHGANQVPAMDQGAPVLVVDERGGTIQHTPLGQPGDNAQEDVVEIAVDARGPARLVRRVTVTGPRSVDFRYRYSLPEKREQVLERDLAAEWGEVELNQAEFANLGRLEQAVMLACTAKVKSLAQERAGGRLALRVTGRRHELSASSTLAERRYDLLLDIPWRDVEHITVRLPEGWKAAVVPQNRSLVTPFGRFEVTVSLDTAANRLVIEKTLERSVTRIAAKDYAAYRAFCNAVDEWENSEAVLER